MTPYLVPGLTPEAASRICMEQCRAGCCQGPLVLALTEDEVQPFTEQASTLGVTALVRRRPAAPGSASPNTPVSDAPCWIPKPARAGYTTGGRAGAATSQLRQPPVAPSPTADQPLWSCRRARGSRGGRVALNWAARPDGVGLSHVLHRRRVRAE